MRPEDTEDSISAGQGERLPGAGDGVASDADYSLCRRIMATASRNYSYASRLLPPDRRRHVDALYAVMRVGDDRVDVSHAGFDTPTAAISAWEEAYYAAFRQGGSPDPVLRAFLNTAQEFAIPVETLTPYFRAMREDLTVTRYPTYADLVHYMDGSAVPVGRAMTRILGIRAPHTMAEALPGADGLAQAMQLGNFCRDVGQDWALGRVYLPLEDLERFGVNEQDLAAGRVSTRFVELMEFEFRRIEALYERAGNSIRFLASGRWAAMAGLEIYRAILPAIRRNGYDVFSRRAETGSGRKLALALRALLRTWAA